MNILKEKSENYGAQFIIATHNPILMCQPNAKLIEITSEEIQEIKPISAIIYLNGEEYELNMKELYKFLSDKLDSYWNEIYEKVDPEYFTNEPDPDAKYDARKNGDFN